MRVFKIICFTALINICFVSMRIDDEGSFNKASKMGDTNKLFLFSSLLIPSELVRWVQAEANGFRQTKTLDEIDFVLQYKPSAYLVCQELKSDSIPKKLYQEKLKQYTGIHYFELKIRLNNEMNELLKHKIKSSQDYKNRVEYYSFNMCKDLCLVVGSDTIPCTHFHFERSFEASPNSTFLVGFPINERTRKIDELTFVYRERIFEKGVVKFTFNINKLVNIPKLKTI